MYFKEITDFKGLYKTFQGSSKSGDIFRAQASIYDGVFCEYTERLTIFTTKAPS